MKENKSDIRKYIMPAAVIALAVIVIVLLARGCGQEKTAEETKTLSTAEQTSAKETRETKDGSPEADTEESAEMQALTETPEPHEEETADGMCTMDGSLFELVRQGRISKETALAVCNNYEFLSKRLGN